MLRSCFIIKKEKGRKKGYLDQILTFLLTFAAAEKLPSSPEPQMPTPPTTPSSLN